MKTNTTFLTKILLTLLSFCGFAGSAWSADIILNETFTNTGIPGGWTNQVLPGGDPNSLWVRDTYGTSPSIMLQRSFDYPAHGARLATPTLNVQGLSNVKLSFRELVDKYHPFNGPYDANLFVRYSTDDGSTWTLLAQFTRPQDQANGSFNDTYKFEVPIPASTTPIKIAFDAYINSNTEYKLDDIIVTADLPASWPVVSASTPAGTKLRESTRNSATWTFTRTGGDQSVALTVPYSLSGTATLGSDYTVDKSNSVTFAAGQATTTLTLTAKDDTVFNEIDNDQKNEFVALSLIAGQSGYKPGQVTGTMEVVDDDGKVSVTATNTTAYEAGPQTGAWTFTRSADPTNELVVYYTLSGTATAGDYTLSSPSSITFPAGQSTVVLTLTPENDELREDDKTVTLALSSNSKYQIGDQFLTTITIVSDDPYDVNVLIVGTTQAVGNAYNNNETSKAFNISSVRTELQKILAGANMGTVNVTLHDFSTQGTLIAEFYNQDPYDPPVSFDFWKNLRGENGKDWDVVILMEEPNTTEYYPAYFSLAAMRIHEEVAKGGAETVLFMPWPGKGSTSTVNHYKEVYYRIGRSLGCKVVPAGLAWEAQGSVHGSGTNPAHPTTDGAYLAAAAIFSRVWGVEGQDKSASTSTYNPNSAVANAVHQLVKDYKAKPSSDIYTGPFVHPVDLFSQMHDTKREWVPNVAAESSTESSVQGWIRMAGSFAGMDLGNSEGTNGPRGVFFGRAWNAYEVKNPFSSGLTMPLGFDPSAVPEVEFINKVDQDATWTVRNSATILTGFNPGKQRHLPHPALFAEVRRVYPDAPIAEFQHGGRPWTNTAASFWVTQFSGRCPIPPESYPKNYIWEPFRVGYESAWAMSTLQARVPGFQIMPSDWTRHEVDPVGPETMTVRFRYKPTHNVTVNISTDQTWASVSPATLTFTPENYDTPQPVTVSVGAEAASLRGSLFNVNYSTSSDDEVYHGLTDSWEYGVNTLPTTPSIDKTILINETIKLTLASTDPDINSRIVIKGGGYTPKQIMSYSLVEGSGPANGQASIDGDLFIYTPNPDFTGLDSVQVRVFDGLAYCAEPATIQFNVIAKGSYNFNLIQNPGAEFGTRQAWFGAGNVTTQRKRSGAYSFSFGAMYQDVDLSDFSAAIAAGVQAFDFSGYGFSASVDTSSIALEFRDANGKVLGTPYESAPVTGLNWQLLQTRLLAPPNAVVARVILRGVDVNSDGSIGASFDDMSLTAAKPDNRAPEAVDPPVAYVAQNVPTVIPLTAIDYDRLPADKLVYEIIEGTGPSHGSITGWKGGMPVYTPDTNYLGNDSFQYRVYDGKLWSANIGIAQIVVRENQAPTITVHTPVMPESNIIYMPATAGVIFETTVTDDGGPVNGALSIQWEQLQGPFQAVFDAPNSPSTACTWGPDINPGTYVFRVTASDGQFSSYKDFTVVVINGDYEREENFGVQVDVGGSHLTVAVGESLTLYGGSLSDDGKPLVPGFNITKWSKVSGPGNATFEKPGSYETKVSFDFGGTYVLRLSVDDGQIKAYEDLTVTVTGPLAGTLTVVGGTAEGGSYFAPGTVVPIVADTPEEGYRFVNWTTSDGGTIADATATSTTYTMPAGNATLTANFALNHAPVISLSTSANTLQLATGNAPFKPETIPTILWVDSSDLKSITRAGDAVISQIKDKSGNNRHLTQSNINYQPKTGIRKFPASTGLNVLDCDGNDWMNVAGVPLPSSGNLAVFAIAGIDAINNEADSIFAFNDINDFQLEAGISSNFRGRINAYGIGGTAVSSANNNLGPSIYNTVFDKTGAGKYTFFVDGTAKSTAQNYTTALSTTQDVIAFANRTKNQSPDGFFGEMLVVEDVSTGTREKIEGYLAYKWKLDDKLPVGHRYESAAPTVSAIVAAANITGTVDDSLDGDSFTTEWFVRSAPEGAVVDFANNDRTAINTTVYFYTPGTYVLRFVATENVPYGVSSYQEVTITVAGEGAVTHTVNYTAGANGSIVGARNQVVSAGLDASSVTAVPDFGYTFIGWSDGLTTSTRTDTNVTADISVTANFEYNEAPTVNAGADQPVQLLPTTPTPWDPASIAQLWLDAADTNTVVANENGFVSEWMDKSPNGLNLVQITPSQQPVTGASIDGKNAIDFTGDRMGTSSNPFGDTVNDGFIIIVNRLDGTTNGHLFSLTGGTTAATLWQSAAPHNGTLYFDCGGAATPNRVSKTYGVNVGSTAMVSFYNSTTDNVQEVYKDGVKLVGDASGHAVPTAGNILIGGVSAYQDVTIGEAVVINGTVSADTRRKLEGYLAHKWGLALPSGHTHESGPPMVENYLATVTLNGSVNDGNGTTPTATWSVVSTQPAGLSVEFANSSSPGTTASFTATGTYTLRLTVNDGVAAPVYDDVVITVVDTPVDSAMSNWLAGYNLGLKNGPNDDADDDRKSNMMEFAFGTDPSQMDMGPLSTDGSKHGDPVAAEEQGGGFALYYIRRTDHGSTGSVIYSTHFSDDLTTFEPSSAGLEVVGSAGAGYELVKVPFPSGARFGYVKIEPAP